ncbi:MAG: P-loop NTPase family protein [Nitrososphaerales archaeon]
MSNEETPNLLPFIKRASQLRGLIFGNRIDTLLQGSLIAGSLTFLYGKNADKMLNVLCGNAIRIFGGRVLFFDTANSYDPSLIIEKCAPDKSEAAAKRFISSITVFSDFTSLDLHSKEIDGSVIAVIMTGIGSASNEQRPLMASSLKKISSTSHLYVVASSSSRAEQFILKCDTAIKLFEDKKGTKAILMKHREQQFSVIDL